MRVKFPKKLRFLFEPHPFKIIYGGRGGLKSKNVARALVMEAGKRKLRILCARETQNSIDESVHKQLSDEIEELGVSHLFKIQQTTITSTCGSEFIFKGLRHNPTNIKSIKGVNIVWVEEAQTVSKTSWDYLLPTLRDNAEDGSTPEVWVTFNTDLETDDTFKRWVLNPPPGAVVLKTTWRDNPWFPEFLRVLKDHDESIDPIGYQTIWEGEPRSMVRGAIFGPSIKAAVEQGRICAVPYNRNRPVDTVWDLGFGDPTVIWFVQAYDGWVNFIDYLESHDETTADYVIELQARKYVYGIDWLPHDGIDTIIHRKLAGTGDRSKSIEALLREAGRNVRLIPKLLITDQINAAKLAFPQFRFDMEKCADGLQALRHYQWETREPKEGDRPLPGEAKVRTTKPKHDWASHASSALMGVAQAIKQPRRAEPEKPRLPVTPPRAPGAYTPFG